MSKNTTTSARLTFIEGEVATVKSDLSEIKAMVARLVGAPMTPPVVTAPAVEAPEVEGLPFRELRAILKAHKVAGRVESGVSVKQMIDAGRMDAFGSLTGAPAEPVKVAAKVEVEAPAKERKPRKVTVTENHASQGPRDAKGRITAKETWETREALAMTGKVGREEIDALVDSGVRVTEESAAALFA
jgi:hypothetical protein